MKRKKLMVFGMLVGSIVVSWWILSFAYAQQTLVFETDQTVFATKIFADLVSKNSPSSRRQAIKNFCDAALSHGLILEPGTNENQPPVKIIYDPRQSVFLYFLCTHADPANREKFQFKPDFRLDKLYLKQTSFDAFKLLCKEKNKDDVRQPVGCVPGCETTTMNTCDLSLFVPQIIDTILNDYSNGALSIIYGIDANEDIDTLVNTIAFKYFTTNLHTDTFPEYPKTKDHAKKFLKKARGLLKKTTLLNIDAMLKVGSKKEKQKAPLCDTNMIDYDSMTYDMFGCIYSPAQTFREGEPVRRGYTNLMYNELMWYNLFGTYRARILRTENNLLPYKITQRPTRERQKLADEALRMEQELAIAKASLAKTVHTLANLQSTFWVHVGLVMYWEEAVKFRNALAKIYTPLHQLYYKLRNVQAEN